MNKKTDPFCRSDAIEPYENMCPPSLNDNSEIVLYQPEDSLRLEVLLENDTVWLSQMQMSELFQITKQNISRHISNIFEERELERNSVVKDYLTTASDGKSYNTKYYNLDVIISVGYRVKSQRGTQFRQWATAVLRDYLLKGHAINRRLERIEHRVGETERKIDFFVRTALPPVQGIFFEGQIFDAHAFVSDLVRSAKRSVVLIDNYVDESVLLLLSKRLPNVTAEIHTKRISPELRMDIEKHNAQYEPVNVYETDRFHDRFLIVDDIVYHIGASFKDLGKKLFAFSKMEMKPQTVLGTR